LIRTLVPPVRRRPSDNHGCLQANLPRLREGPVSVNPLSSRVRGLCNRDERVGGGERFRGQKNLLLELSRSKLSAATCPGCQLRLAEPPTRTSGARSNRKPLYVRRPALSTPAPAAVFVSRAKRWETRKLNRTARRVHRIYAGSQGVSRRLAFTCAGPTRATPAPTFAVGRAPHDAG
jgi:hypothetical protein